MHQIRNSIAFHYKFYGNQRRLYDIPKTAHTVRHNLWTAEDNGFWSSPRASVQCSVQPSPVRCECGDIGPGNCTALTQPRCPTHNIAAATSIKIYIWTLFASVGKLKISINYHNIIPTASRPIKTGYLETVGRCWRLLLPGTKTLPPHQELPLCPVSQCCDDAGDTCWLVAGAPPPSPPRVTITLTISAVPGTSVLPLAAGNSHLSFAYFHMVSTLDTLLCQSSISDIRKQMETAIKCNVSCRGDY